MSIRQEGRLSDQTHVALPVNATFQYALDAAVRSLGTQLPEPYSVAVDCYKDALHSQKTIFPSLAVPVSAALGIGLQFLVFTATKPQSVPSQPIVVLDAFKIMMPRGEDGNVKLGLPRAKEGSCIQNSRQEHHLKLTPQGPGITRHIDIFKKGVMSAF